MTPQEIAAELRVLSDEMSRLGGEMDYLGGLGQIGDHGRELIRAGAIARDWAAGIDVEEATA